MIPEEDLKTSLASKRKAFHILDVEFEDLHNQSSRIEEYEMDEEDDDYYNDDYC